MPKLRETYLHIQERNAREIRQRTRDRIKALQRVEERVVVNDLLDTPVAEQSYTVPILVCIIVFLVLVCLLLAQQI
jgi:hypothetical protein